VAWNLSGRGRAAVLVLLDEACAPVSFPLVVSREIIRGSKGTVTARGPGGEAHSLPSSSRKKRTRRHAPCRYERDAVAMVSRRWRRRVFQETQQPVGMAARGGLR